MCHYFRARSPLRLIRGSLKGPPYDSLQEMYRLDEGLRRFGGFGEYVGFCRLAMFVCIVGTSQCVVDVCVSVSVCSSFVLILDVVVGVDVGVFVVVVGAVKRLSGFILAHGVANSCRGGACVW